MAITIQASVSSIRDQYRLVKVVGGNDSTDEYLAIDQRTNQNVLVQVIRPGALPTADARESILGRLAIAAGFERPDVLAIRQVSQDSDRVVVVREWPEGPSIAARLAAGPVPLVWSAGIVAATLRAAESAAAANVAHPGLTPGSIFATEAGKVQIGDLGMPLLPAASVLPGITNSITALPPAVAVRAPEQVAGRSADLAAQQYAAAAILYWMLAGRPPFLAATPGELREQQTKLTPPPVTEFAPECPPALADLIARGLIAAPAERVASLAEFLAALEALVPRVPAPAKKVESRGRFPWRLFWVSSAAAITVSIGGLGIIGPARAAIQSATTPQPPESVSAYAARVQSPVQAAPPAAPVVPVVSRSANVWTESSRMAEAAACWGSDWVCVINSLSRVVEQNPANLDATAKLAAAQVNRGYELIGNQDWTGAKSAFAAAQSLQPDLAEAGVGMDLVIAYQRGVDAYNRSDWQTATREFGSVAAINPRIGEAVKLAYASWTNAGLEALQARNLAAAVENCTQALRFQDGGEAEMCLLRAQPPAASALPIRQVAVTAPVRPASPVTASKPVITGEHPSVPIAKVAPPPPVIYSRNLPHTPRGSRYVFLP